MKDVLTAAAHLQRVLDESGRASCFIGGVAVQRWGEVRVTKDADAAIRVDLGEEPEVIDLLAAHFDLRRPDTLEFARIFRVILLQTREASIGLDVSLAASGFESQAIERATEFTFAQEVVLRTCSAEDLIVYKAVADREIDWHDIRGVLIRQYNRLDMPLIEDQLEPLVQLKEAPHIWDRWADLRQRYDGKNHS